MGKWLMIFSHITPFKLALASRQALISNTALTNWVWGSYWWIVARGCGRTNWVQWGLSKTTKGQYSPVQLKHASLVSVYHNYSTWALNLPALESQKYDFWRCLWKGSTWQNPGQERSNPVRILGFTSRLPCRIIKLLTDLFHPNHKMMKLPNWVIKFSSFFISSFNFLFVNLPVVLVLVKHY